MRIDIPHIGLIKIAQRKSEVYFALHGLSVYMYKTLVGNDVFLTAQIRNLDLKTIYHSHCLYSPAERWNGGRLFFIHGKCYSVLTVWLKEIEKVLKGKR